MSFLKSKDFLFCRVIEFENMAKDKEEILDELFPDEVNEAVVKHEIKEIEQEVKDLKEETISNFETSRPLAAPTMPDVSARTELALYT